MSRLLTDFLCDLTRVAGLETRVWNHDTLRANIRSGGAPRSLRGTVGGIIPNLILLAASAMCVSQERTPRYLPLCGSKCG